MSAITALIVLADGSEEMEAVIVIDVLRRAGWEVTVASLEGGPVTASRQVRLLPDAAFAEVADRAFDLIVLPGGLGGVERFRASEALLGRLRRQAAEGGHLAAVCAGPLALQAAGLLEGRRATCHPSVADQLTQTGRLEEEVVVDGRLVTSQGPGTSMDFALALVAELDGPERARSVAAGMVYRHGPHGKNMPGDA